jgi:hypothetical protein
MGRSILPKYRLELQTQIGHLTPFAWSGRATVERVARYILDLNESLIAGGVNHVPRERPIIVVAARLVEQRTGRIVITWELGRGARLATG